MLFEKKKKKMTKISKKNIKLLRRNPPKAHPGHRLDSCTKLYWSVFIRVTKVCLKLNKYYCLLKYEKITTKIFLHFYHFNPSKKQRVWEYLIQIEPKKVLWSFEKYDKYNISNIFEPLPPQNNPQCSKIHFYHLTFNLRQW